MAWETPSSFRQAVKQRLKSLKSRDPKTVQAALSALQTMLSAPENSDFLTRNWQDIISEFAVTAKIGYRDSIMPAVLQFVGGSYVGVERFTEYVEQRCTTIQNLNERDFLFYTLEQLVQDLAAKDALSTDNVKFILAFICEVFDQDDAVNEAAVLIRLSSLLGTQYPTVFEEFLGPVCEHVTGWMIDTRMAKTITSSTTAFMLSMKPMFAAHPDVPQKFISSLHSDIVEIVKGLAAHRKSAWGSFSDEESTEDNELQTLIPMLHTLGSFLKSGYTEAQKEKFSEFAAQISAFCREHLTTLESLRCHQVNRAFDAFEGLLRLTVQFDKSPQTLQLYMDFILTVIQHPLVNGPALKTTLSRIELVLNIGKRVRDTVYATLFGTPMLLSLLPLENKLVAGVAIEAYQKCLDVSDFERLPPIYSRICCRIKEIKEQLLQGPRPLGEQGTRLRIEFVSLLLALKPVFHAKNSLVVNSGLNPPPWVLVLDEIGLRDLNFAKRHASIHLAALGIAIDFCQCQESFLGASDFYVNPSVNSVRATSELQSSRRCKAAARVIAALTELVAIVDQLPRGNGEAIIRWVLLIAHDSLVTPLLHDWLFVRLRWALVMHVFNVVKQPTLKKREYRTIMERFQLPDLLHAKEENWSRVLGRLRLLENEEIADFFSFFPATLCIRPIGDGEFATAFERIQPILGENKMCAREFQILAEDLLVRPPTALTILKPTSVTDAILAFNSGSLKLEDKLRTILDQMALYVIENRMKTVYGKPLETLTTFEGCLRSMAAQVLELRNSQNPLFPDDSVADNEAVRVHSLLVFVDALSKFMHYAESGSVVDIAVLSKNAKQFFVNNFATCQSWLTRVTVVTMQVAFYAGHYGQVVHLGQLFFLSQKLRRDTQPRAQMLPLSLVSGDSGSASPGPRVSQPVLQKLDDFHLAVVCWMVRALVELKSPQAIRGVFDMLVANFCCAKPVFIEAAELISAGHYEEAYDLLIEIKTQGEPRIVVEVVNDFICRIAKSLRLRTLSIGSRDLSGDSWDRATSLTMWKPQKSFEELSIVDSQSWEIDRRLDDLELAVMAVFDGVGLQKMKSADADDKLKVVSQRVLDLQRTIMAFSLARGLRTRVFVLQAVVRCLRAKISRPSDFTVQKACDELVVSVSSSLRENWADNSHFLMWITKVAAPQSKISVDVHEALFRLSRKHLNIRMAETHLSKLRELQPQPQQKFVPSQVIMPTPYPGAPWGTPMQVVVPVMQPRFLNSSNFNIAFESAKIQYLRFKDSAFLRLADSVAEQSGVFFPHLYNQEPEFIPLAQKVRKACLKLAKWCHDVDSDSLNIFCTSVAPKTFWSLVLNRMCEFSTTKGPWQQNELVAGALCHTAAKIDDTLILATATPPSDVTTAKAHRKLAEWTVNQLYGGGDGFVIRLSAAEEEDVSALGINDDKMLMVAKKYMGLADDLTSFKNEMAAGLPTDVTAKFESLRFEATFNQVKARQKKLFDLSLKAYMRYFQCLGPNTNSTIHSATATLHVIQLLVSNPTLFKASAQSKWFIDTNARIWKDVIPQLFARLNHPDARVRSEISQLLLQIAKASPHAICYPAVVGAYYSRMIDIPTESEGPSDDKDDLEDIEEGFEPKGDRSLMSSACLSLVEAIQVDYPQLVPDVITFVREMQRIHMLHEEKWAFVLSNLDHEMPKRIRHLENERQKTFACSHLSDVQKEEVVLKRTDLYTGIILQIITDLYSLTCKSAENDNQLTKNEASFINEFEKPISRALLHFGENRLTNLKEAWKPFKDLATEMQKRALRKTSLGLLTADISPWLASLNGSAIPIPGQELKETDVVTIKRVKAQINILLTKTRPKKITFIGSDDKEYVFLFKGQEDLHLDERVMQLLHICNLMLRDVKQHSVTDVWPQYASRNYTVTPLGIRSGLIRWVDGATPMYQIYRKWKTRHAGKTAGDGEVNANAERPINAFVRQLKAVFDDNQLSHDFLLDRKKWPHRQILDRLIAETPRDILARELWMQAGDSETWWRITERFARSTAVASMVGAVIGLGDRHLDNLLIDLTTGNVVHIDYNVCFDKGEQLRIPETVPFRLTGNIVYALGPTQVEGTFRQSCEHVLAVLREQKDTLLTMMDAFVYDPLVDWAMQDQLANTAVNVNVGTVLAVYGCDDHLLNRNKLTLDFFQLGLRECSVPWTAVAKKLEDSLTEVLYHLQRLYESRNQVTTPTEDRDRGLAGNTLKAAIAEHNQLFVIFRPHIKTLAGVDARFVAYYNHYREFFRNPVIKGLNLLNMKTVNYAECIALLRCAAEHVQEVHDGLLQLGKLVEQCALPPTTAIEHQLNGTTTGVVNSPGPEVGHQHRILREDENTYAKQISKRIRCRLEGRVRLPRKTSDSASPSGEKEEAITITPSAQVKALIDSAMDANHLALMYEGWTAWV